MTNRFEMWLPRIAVAILLSLVTPAPALRAQAGPDATAEVEAMAARWFDLYSSHRAAELCALLTEDFTSRSDWGAKTGKTLGRAKVCSDLALTERNPTFLVFNTSGFDVTFPDGPGGSEAVVRFDQYYCQSRPDLTYSSIGRKELRLRRVGGEWRFAQDVFMGRKKKKGFPCLPQPEPDHPGCSRDMWCPTNPVLFRRLLTDVCRGRRLTQAQYRDLGADDLRTLLNAFSALHGYTFDSDPRNAYFYGPGADERLPDACSFQQDPTYDRKTKKTRLTKEEFRQQVEIRDYVRTLP